MAELTIQLPEELAQRLEPLKSRIPELLWQVLEISNQSTAKLQNAAANRVDISPVYNELLDFLIKRPTPEEITSFKVSQQAQSRLRTLLDKNREATLTESEVSELDLYEQLEHLMILIKARAYASIKV